MYMDDNYEIDLLKLPEILKEMDDSRLKDLTEKIPIGMIHKCISRDKLTDKEIEVLTILLNCICQQMDKEQKEVYETMINYENNENINYNIFNSKANLIKIPITILNAPAGTGKTLVTLAFQIKMNLVFGYKHGAIMFAPSYASLDAVANKITEYFNDYFGVENEEQINQYTKLARECVSINIINDFYACGSQSFNIHDSAVAAKVIQKFRRANCNSKYDDNYHDLYRLNNVQAVRETRAIICDEAFFTTSNRCTGFVDMLVKGYIDHPYLNKNIRKQYHGLIDNIVFRKKLVFSGDPYQLAVSVEQKEPGVEKYLIEEGNPLWYWNNQLRNCVRLTEDINNPELYQLLTLKTNYRFGPDVPSDLKIAIENVREVTYKNDEDKEEFDLYKEKVRTLLHCMDNHEMIKWNKDHNYVVESISNEDKYKLYAISEIHAASKKINMELDKISSRNSLQSINAKTEFVYGKKNEEKMDWILYDKYITDYVPINYENSFRNRYKLGCKNGSFANKYPGLQYPSQCNEKNYKETRLYINDKVRVSLPLNKKSHNITRVVNESNLAELPEDFKINTGTFGRIIEFNGTTVHIEICNEEDAKKYNNILGKENIILKNHYETSNPVFAIKYSEDLGAPYFKSAFCNSIIPEKEFNVAVHSYPFTKEAASTIHSLQGKTINKTEKIIYYMYSIKKKDLNDVSINNVGAWKGSLPNLLYVALTRSRVPHTNFTLVTSCKNISELLKNITSGKRPKAYSDLKDFNKQFNKDKRIN